MENLTKLNLDEYKPLRDVVFENLRGAIVEGRLKPGERLMEVQLAEQLGVSRTPVREAIRKLELEGLVVMLPRKGAYVANMSLKDLIDVLEIRASLEGLAASLAAERITDEDIKKFLRKRYHYNLKKFKRAWKIVEKNKNLSVRPLLLRFMDELLEEEYSFEYDFQLYEYLFDKWIERERRNINEELGKNLYEECLIMAKKIYSQWQKSGKIGVYLNDIKTDMSFDGIEAIQLKGHALINRTSDGMYKFSHKSYWEFLLAKLAISDFMFADELLIKNFDRATAFLEEMIQYNKTNLDQSSPSFYVGVANYYLKYGKPECAEEQLKMVINSYSENRTLHLYIIVIKIRIINFLLLEERPK